MLAAIPAQADAYVRVTYNGFSPQAVEIAPNETVYWYAGDDLGPYMISSDLLGWPTLYLIDRGDADGITFSKVGDYTYYDAINYNYGIVHVRYKTVNQPPSITITNPAASVVLPAPASFSFAADASDSDDGVMQVDFYLDGSLLETVYSSPYATAVTDLAAGSHALMAVATDYAQASATNTLTLTVGDAPPVTITLSAPRMEDGQFKFEAAGMTAGKTIVLQATSDPSLADGWTSIQTTQAGAATITLTVIAEPGVRFFRVQQSP
jgi:hypothetical protein